MRNKIWCLVALAFMLVSGGFSQAMTNENIIREERPTHIITTGEVNTYNRPHFLTAAGDAGSENPLPPREVIARIPAGERLRILDIREQTVRFTGRTGGGGIAYISFIQVELPGTEELVWIGDGEGDLLVEAVS